MECLKKCEIILYKFFQHFFFECCIDKTAPESTWMRWRHRSSGKQPLTVHESLLRGLCNNLCKSLLSARIQQPCLRYSPLLRFSVWRRSAAQLLITNEPSWLFSYVSSNDRSSDLCGLFMEISIRVEIENLTLNIKFIACRRSRRPRRSFGRNLNLILIFLQQSLFG